MGMNASLWNQAGELPDRDDEPGPLPGPKIGEEYTLAVAVAPDGGTLVIAGPEEFWHFASDEYGSRHLQEAGGSSELEAGVYQVRCKFQYEPGRGEAGSHDPSADEVWFDPIDWSLLYAVESNPAEAGGGVRGERSPDLSAGQAARAAETQ